MATTDRQTTRYVARIRRGDAITARYLNRIGEGVNQALQAIEPPRSLKTRSTAEQINELSTDPGTTWIATSATTSTVRVFQEGSEDVFVDVLRFETVTFEAGGESLILDLRPVLVNG